jgi:hypothetical protein
MSFKARKLGTRYAQAAHTRTHSETGLVRDKPSAPSYPKHLQHNRPSAAGQGSALRLCCGACMFGLFKKKKPQPPLVSPIYDVLFGDVPLERWKPADEGSAVGPGPWQLFDEVRAALSGKDKRRAQQLLMQLLADPALETRQHLQAWNVLRELGVQPEAAEAKQVLGVVLEVALEQGQGNDTLAAYRDHRARFISHSGKLIVWDSRDPQVEAQIEQLLNAGQQVAEKIGPWTEPRCVPPSNGNVRVSLLTPSGLRCGEGPFKSLARDRMAGPVITLGAKLMGGLIGRASQAQGSTISE